MRLRIRMYYSHDMDLISLYRLGCISFPEATRQVLDAYANGEAFHLVADPEQISPRRTKQARESRKQYYYDVTLNETKNTAAVALINDIEMGRRTNFVKTLLRQYLCCPIPSVYSISGDTKLFDRMTEKFAGRLEERNLDNKKKKKADKAASNDAVNAATGDMLKGVSPETKQEDGKKNGSEENTVHGPDHDKAMPQAKPSDRKSARQAAKDNPTAVGNPVQAAASGVKKAGLENHKDMHGGLPQSMAQKDEAQEDGQTEALEENVDSMLAEMMEEY